ncbi:uncharacterized protein [Parasteatoda tepidariorum]|uniref:uncharacterized protein n=1 Tax=Parasteatoda tepidariorum TaxID=114398 RepID=UPI0039BC5466
MSQSPRLFMDGTFKTVPKLFAQLYTIHGCIMGRYYPFAYCLLINKEKTTYVRLFDLLKGKALALGISLNPNSVLIDFERSCISALKDTFPYAAVKGCFFHYGQCIWRKVQELGLSSAYRNDDEVRQWVQRIGALPLVPPESMGDAIIYIENTAPDCTEAMDLFSYVADTWVDECDSMFLMDIWNHYDNPGDRTNNIVESWHSKFNRRAQKSHLNLFAFIELLQQEEAENHAEIQMLLQGNLRPT